MALFLLLGTGGLAVFAMLLSLSDSAMPETTFASIQS